jgi:ABC-type multidrug transport system ATPase subunit
MSLAIETHQLTRSYGARFAVDRIDLAVPRGAIYGFLGPNGAGKTTTIRLLLGLLRPGSGEILLNGQPFSRDRRGLLRGIGALVEAPSLYPHLTGEENLEITRRLLDVSRSRVPEVLDLFGLTQDARRPVSTYSSGMRQLLGLALAWLGDPRLLVLDEPTNSLDPAATRKLRTLLRRITTERGVTVFFSSHVLSEVDQLVDRVGIIDQGRLLFQGELSSLKQTRPGSLEDIFLDLVAAGGGSTA